MIVAIGYAGFRETLVFTCAESAQWLVETHYYSPVYGRFPGTGTQFPVAPGGVVVLATDAIDHSVVNPAWPDLSRADWEFLGPADVDNPHVPNIVHGGASVGFDRGIDPFFNSPHLLLGPVDVAGLPTAPIHPSRPAYVGFPTAAIHDLWFNDESTLTPCPHRIPSVFDRQPARLRTRFPRDPFDSTHRRVLGHTEDGRPILQDTRSTFADIVIGRRSPGTVGVIEPVPPN